VRQENNVIKIISLEAVMPIAKGQVDHSSVPVIFHRLIQVLGNRPFVFNNCDANFHFISQWALVISRVNGIQIPSRHSIQSKNASQINIH
jgi:hypothetical protein